MIMNKMLKKHILKFFSAISSLNCNDSDMPVYQEIMMELFRELLNEQGFQGVELNNDSFKMIMQHPDFAMIEQMFKAVPEEQLIKIIKNNKESVFSLLKTMKIEDIKNLNPTDFLNIISKEKNKEPKKTVDSKKTE